MYVHYTIRAHITLGSDVPALRPRHRSFRCYTFYANARVQVSEVYLTRVNNSPGLNYTHDMPYIWLYLTKCRLFELSV